MMPLRISAFPNAKALPLWIAQERDLFANRALAVEIDWTESSKAQREGLSSGRLDLVQSAIDNGLSLITSGHDVIIAMGGEAGMNDFIVQPEIDTIEDLKGRILVVDSPDTAYALLARKMLARAGLVYNRDYTMQPVGNGSRRLAAMLQSKDAAGGVLNPPFTAQAKAAGLKSLGRLVDHLGPYQAGGLFVLRAFAESHSEALESFISAYIEALRFARDPANAPFCIHLLRDQLLIDDRIAGETLAEMLDPAFGFAIDAKLDENGLANVLATRSETEGVDARLTDPKTFIDEQWYHRALARI
jgi:ABC-type nitrate/sulfonate/bicarbonate transport system substrate-binding protein